MLYNEDAIFDLRAQSFTTEQYARGLRPSKTSDPSQATRSQQLRKVSETDKEKRNIFTPKLRYVFISWKSKKSNYASNAKWKWKLKLMLGLLNYDKNYASTINRQKPIYISSFVGNCNCYDQLVTARTSCRPISNSVCNHTRDWQIDLTLRGRPILLNPRVITVRIGLHSV